MTKETNENRAEIKAQNEKTLAALRAGIEAFNPRSAWEKGLKAYADLLLYQLSEFVEWEGAETITPENLEKILLNGARDWREFSYGECALIRDFEIAETLCSPAALKRYTRKDGSLRDKPNARETWLDCQARALFQTSRLLVEILKEKVA